MELTNKQDRGKKQGINAVSLFHSLTVWMMIY